jgi:hypothetical protein
VGLAPAASSEPATETYQGTWSSAQLCDGSTPEASGNWTVVTRADGTAVVHAAILLEGKHHASWGGMPWQLVQQDPGTDVFNVSNGFQTLVLHQSGQLTYTLSGYCEPGDASVTGQLGR